MRLHRTIAIGLLSIGTIAGCTPSAGAHPVVDIQPSIMRAVCATSSCFLVTDLPGAGIGGKT